MAPRRGKRRSRRARFNRQSIDVKGYITATSKPGSNSAILSMDSIGSNRDYRPRVLKVTATSASPGNVFMVDLRGPDGSSLRIFGPYQASAVSRTYSFVWPASTSWWTAGGTHKGELAKIRVLPRQGITTEGDQVSFLMSASVTLSDYNSGVTFDFQFPNCAALSE